MYVVRIIMGVVGLVATALIGAKIYKIITKPEIIESVKEKFKTAYKAVVKEKSPDPQDVMDQLFDGFDVKVKERVDNHKVVKLDVFDSCDQNIGEITIYGESISEDICTGDVIYIGTTN